METDRLTSRILLFLLPVFLVYFACGDVTTEGGDTLAKVGDKIITVDDFIKRAELTPRMRNRSVNGHTGNRALLEMLIGEKLLAIHAEQTGFDQDEDMLRQRQHIESQAVQRELYNDEVLNQIQVEEEEILRAFDRSQKTIVVKYYSSQKRDDVVQFRELIQENSSFDAALRNSLGEGFSRESHMAQLTWGKVDETIEDAIYNLRPNEVSPILETNGGYVVLQVENIIMNPLQTEGQLFQKRSSITKTIRMRKADMRSSGFVQDYMATHGVTIEGRAFGLLVSELEKRVRDSSGSPQKVLPLEHVSALSESELIRQNRNEVVAASNEGNLTLGEVIQLLQIFPIPIHDRSPGELKAQLSNQLLALIRDEQLAREGFRRGLQERQAVRDELRVWEDYFLYKKMQKKWDLRPQSSEDITFSRKLEELKAKSSININSKKLALIKLTDIPLIAVWSGQSNQLAVPPWPQVF
jgi:hypothetical protein